MIDIILDENKSVLYADYDINISNTSVETKHWVDITLNSSNCTKINIDSNTLPTDFCARLYFFVDGKFVLNSQEAELRRIEKDSILPLKPRVPKTITPRQARLVLLGAGLLDDIEALLATDKAMQIWWEYSLEVDRDNAHIVTAGTALGLTELQLDEMFIAASKL